MSKNSMWPSWGEMDTISEHTEVLEMLLSWFHDHESRFNWSQTNIKLIAYWKFVIIINYAVCCNSVQYRIQNHGHYSMMRNNALTYTSVHLGSPLCSTRYTALIQLPFSSNDEQYNTRISTLSCTIYNNHVQYQHNYDLGWRGFC
jgi:hypothetical protein